jgi:hypothetical protein
MTIQWHLTTGPHVDVLQISGFLGERHGHPVQRGRRLGVRPRRADPASGPHRLQGWSAQGLLAVTTAAQSLARQQLAMELVAPPAPVKGIPSHADLEGALRHHRAAAGEPTTDAWHSTSWQTDSTP